MAPEILSNNYNENVDVYALGHIFYYLLSRRYAFDGFTKE